MLDTIILLTGPVERPVLTLVLQGHNPRLSVQAVATSVELAALRPRSLRSARLIAFWTDTLVPAAVLHRLAFGAYNFHPGPPRFPGWGAAHFAVHRGATEFGATAHVMVDKVDAGAIVGVERFWIPRGSTALQLEEMAYAGAARLFWRLARPLANEPEALPTLPITWQGRKGTRRRSAKICGGTRRLSRQASNRAWERVLQAD